MNELKIDNLFRLLESTEKVRIDSENTINVEYTKCIEISTFRGEEREKIKQDLLKLINE